MSNTCPKCGAIIDTQYKYVRKYTCGTYEVSCDAGWLVSHEGEKCVRDQLAKAEAEAKRYREAWGRLRAYQVETVDSMESNANEVVRFIAAPRHRTTLKKMDDLIAPAEQGTTHD